MIKSTTNRDWAQFFALHPLAHTPKNLVGQKAPPGSEYTKELFGLPRETR